MNTEPIGFKGTPTEWKVYPKESETMVYCDDEVGSLIADCTVRNGFKLKHEEKKANAALIAQSKRMAVVLQNMVEAFKGMPYEPEYVIEAKAILAEAIK